MSNPEEKIVKIIDESVHTRGASVEQVESQGALIVKAVDTTVGIDTTGLATDATLTDGSQISQIKETVPTDGDTKLNASVSVTEAVDGTVTTTTIVKTIGGTDYTKTVASDSSDNSILISAWV